MKKRVFFPLILLLALLLSGTAYLGFRLGQNKTDTTPNINLELLVEADKAAPENNALDTLPTPSTGDNHAETVDEPAPTEQPVVITPVAPLKKQIRLGFVGDVNLDEESKPVKYLEATAKTVRNCFSSDLFDLMHTVDVMMMNNEFCYSSRGTKIEGKQYTYRADPERANLLHEMGIDIVSLANNHALDFGQEALLDTFDVLDTVGVPYVGAGRNLEEAMEAEYFSLGDKTIAYVSGSRVVYDVDWYATDTRPGMLATYDDTDMVKAIRKAKEQSDFVVAYVHWGIEREEYPVDYQKALARAYIDAGADAVIGGHPHVIQGIEYYEGKPILYSLGNYWFANYGSKSAFAELILEDDNVALKLYPVYSEGGYTEILKGDKAKDYFSYMESISFDITIDEEGIITPN